MKIAVRQAVAVAPARAIAAYANPAFYIGRPGRDDIAVVEVVRHDDLGEQILVEVRFAFTGSLSGAVRRVIDPAKMSWVTRTEVRPADMRTSWTVLPDHYPDRLSASGSYRFEPGDDGPDSTVVHVEGDLKVHVPIVGRSVEKVIVTDLRQYIVDEVTSIPGLAL
ncbi:MAG: DUF2505 family protein [Acidimicrobiales bacterium]